MRVARRSQAAEKDLQEIAFQIAVRDRRPLTADKIIDELIVQSNNLAQTSGVAEMGTSAPEIGSGVRLYSHKRWVVVFRYAERGIDVLRIVDGSQDFIT